MYIYIDIYIYAYIDHAYTKSMSPLRASWTSKQKSTSLPSEHAGLPGPLL